MAVLLLACGAGAQVSDTLSLTLTRTKTDSGLGLGLDQSMYVVEVDAPSAASRAGVLVGMRLSSIDGELYLDRMDAFATLNKPGTYAINMHLACLRFTEAIACSGDCTWDGEHAKCAPKSLFPNRINPPTISPSRAPTSLIPPSAQQEQFQLARLSTTDSTGFVVDGAQVISQVLSGSPAGAAGLRNGMKVVRVNGQVVNGMLELQAALMQAPASFTITVLAHCTTFRSASLCNAARDAPEYAPGCFWTGTECTGWNGQSTASPEVVGLLPGTPQVQSSDTLIGGLPVGAFVGIVVGVVVFIIVLVVLVWHFCCRKTDDGYELGECDEVYEIHCDDITIQQDGSLESEGEVATAWDDQSCGGGSRYEDQWAESQTARSTSRWAGASSSYYSPHGQGYRGPTVSPTGKSDFNPSRGTLPQEFSPGSIRRAESYVSQGTTHLSRGPSRSGTSRMGRNRQDLFSASFEEANQSRWNSGHYTAPPGTWATLSNQ